MNEFRKEINRGDIVTIRKGSIVRSLHPKKGNYQLRRNQTVKVHLFLRGYEYEGKIYPAEISWSGTGGYWCYARRADIINGILLTRN